MSIEAAIYARLSAAPPIGATVAVGQRLQGSVLPAVTFAIEGIEPVRSLAGTSSLFSTRVRCSCWATTYAGARTLANAVVTRMSGWTGTVGATVISTSRHAAGEPQDLSMGEGEEDLPAQIDELFVIHHT
jgi:hypothetical protein